MNRLRHAFIVALCVCATPELLAGQALEQTSPQAALNYEMGQLMSLAHTSRPQENLCQMSGTYTALLDMLRVGLDEELGQQMDSLRGRVGLHPADALGLHKEMAEAICAARDRVLLACRHYPKPEDLAPSYERASIVLLRDALQIAADVAPIYDEAGARQLNFSDPAQGLDLVNTLVNAATDGAVPHILDEIEPNAVAILAAAAKLSGAFRIPFQDAQLDLSFHNADGTSSQPHWMRQTHPLPYKQFTFADALVCDAVQLPCHGQINFALLTAHEPEEALAVLAALGEASHWDSVLEWLGQDECFSRQVCLTAPRCKVDSGSDYFQVYAGEALMQLLAMQDWNGQLFENCHEEILLTQLVDKHCFELGPTGFHMAGAAAAAFATRSAILQDPIEVTLDHPFAFIIWEEQTGTVLGAGLLKQLSDAL